MRLTVAIRSPAPRSAPLESLKKSGLWVNSGGIFLLAWSAAAAVGVLTAPTGLSAQGAPQPLPGLIVTIPGASVPQSPPVAAPAPAPVATQPPPPAKQKTAARPAPKALIGAPGSGPSSGSGQAIIVLVNDEPISAYDLDERAKLLALQSNIGERASATLKQMATSEQTNQRWRKIVEDTVQQNQGKTRDQILAILEQKKAVFGDQLRQQALASARSSALPGARKAAIEELIDERLKTQEAKRLNVTPDDAEVDNIIKGIASRNKMTEVQFAQHLKSMGGDVGVMKAKFRTTLGWNEVVRRKFGQQINVNQRDIDRFVEQAGKGELEVELQVTRVLIPLGSGNLDQRSIALRLDEADKLRRGFKGCKGAAAQAASLVAGAKTEDLGWRKLQSFPEPARTLLFDAQEGEILPPNPTSTGIELFAVCQRKVTTADEAKRNEAQTELRQREFELHARRLLKDLRNDAYFDWRDKSYTNRPQQSVDAAN